MYAKNALGAASRATFGVTVVPYDGSVEDLSSVTANLATEAFDSGDTDTVMQVGNCF